jgi:alkylhydroperoxidase/carboxymuconolactone decarboxylase family protein YurZ
MIVLKEIFGDSSDWVQSFVRQMPQTSTMYNGFLSGIWEDGHLSKKYKLLILTGVCLAQGRTEMIRQMLASMPERRSISSLEFLEIVSAVLLSRGPIALFTAWEAGILSAAQPGESPVKRDEPKPDKEAILEYFRANMGEVPAWIRMLDAALPAGVEQYHVLRNSILVDGAVPRKIKELTLVAVNAAGLYGEGLRIHAIGVMNTGGTKEELLEGLLLAFIGGGIVAWLEGIKVLTEAKLI